jgi:glycerol-3-phosphate dehydrogenase subunit B
MQAGVDALARKPNCLIVDFKGLRGFSARQVTANLRQQWPTLRAERLTFPDMPGGEIYPEVMARALEVPATRERLCAAIKTILGDAEVVGMPAIMGMHNPDFVMAEISRHIGCPVFEIPTMPPSVPGIRLRELFEQVLPQKGLIVIPQQKVRLLDLSGEKVKLSLSDNFGPIILHAKTAILATGRFLSGGLEANLDGITEPLLGLDVSQPSSRDDWYGLQYMDIQGHGIHKCGIEVDDHFRPLDRDGKIADPRLFIAGAILAHQDWIRGRCGAGVAIASAYKAVNEAHQVIRGDRW